MDIDANELRSLSADITRAGDKVLPDVEKVVFKGAMNVKNGMRRQAESSRSFKGISPSISFDLTASANGVEAEIGPKHGPGEAGNLANIAYFGTSRGGGTVDFEGPLREEQPKFEKAIAEVLKNVL